MYLGNPSSYPFHIGGCIPFMECLENLLLFIFPILPPLSVIVTCLDYCNSFSTNLFVSILVHIRICFQSKSSFSPQTLFSGLLFSYLDPSMAFYSFQKETKLYFYMEGKAFLDHLPCPFFHSFLCVIIFLAAKTCFPFCLRHFVMVWI